MGEVTLTGLSAAEVAGAFQFPQQPSPHVVAAVGSDAFFQRRAWEVGRVALGLRWIGSGEDSGFADTLREIGELAKDLLPSGEPVIRLSRQTSESVAWFTLLGGGRLTLFGTELGSFGLFTDPAASWAATVRMLLDGGRESELIIAERFTADGGSMLVHHLGETRWGPVSPRRRVVCESVDGLIARISDPDWGRESPHTL